MSNALKNAPEVNLALVGVSRDCFPAELTQRRLDALAKSCGAIGLKPVVLKTIIENEDDTVAALAEAEAAGCNAAAIFLGNFGPEGPLSIFAERFPGPSMLCAAAEENTAGMIDGRGDAFCGMLNASLNMELRAVPVHIPEQPVGLPDELAPRIAHFVDVARVLIGLDGLKVITFGPRPHDFYACNAPIGQIYDMGIEVMENSELDLLMEFQKVEAGEPEVQAIAKEMADELGAGNSYPDLLVNLARYEVTLERFVQANLGSRQFAVMANKCWPSFEAAFKFVPCFVNGRLAAKGMPVACEVDMYGAISEYAAYLASGKTPTILDINNTVPADMIPSDPKALAGAAAEDLFMGFHCGNVSSGCMKSCSMKYQLIMNRLMEPEAPEPDITRGTLEGQLITSPTTLFRIQGTPDGGLQSYIAEGEILDIDPQSFGSIGVFAIPGFQRFYRHVMVGQGYPHHGAVAFDKVGKTLYDAVSMIGIENIGTPLPAGQLYPNENPFA